MPVEVDVTALPEIDRLAPELNTNNEDDDEEKEEEEDGDEEEEEEVLVSSVTFGTHNKRKQGKKSSSAWDWSKDLMAILKNIAGLKKLCADRPSTAAIGNWGILQAVTKMSTECAEPSLGKDGVQARLFWEKKTENVKD